LSFGKLHSQPSNFSKNELITDSTYLTQNEKELIPFQLLDSDTIILGPNDELIKDQYTALGQSYVYDALHSFNFRRSDKFGGYINEKINTGLERIRKKGYKSDIKKLYIQIDPLTLSVYWFAVVGPSQNKFSYVRIDSRGSAGGYLKAVEKQLPKMHNLYPELVPEKFLEFNENVTTCYSWDGEPLDNYSGYINIQQHFFKYRERFETQKPLMSESKLDLIFGEEIDTLLSKSNSITEKKILTQQLQKYDYTDKLQLKKKKTVTKIYKVKRGDTLSEIAEKHRVSVIKIQKANNLRSNKIKEGQILKIPI
jgi:hypothetical protein